MKALALSPAACSVAAPDDWDLLVSGGEPFAGLEVLFERHKDFVFRLACGVLGDRDLADDATQEVFLRMARGRRRWRPRAQFRTWLYKLTVNTCRELERRRRRQRRETPVAAIAAVPSPLTDLVLDQAFRELPLRQREAVILRFLEGLSTRETARVMGCREGTVKSHLHRALETLRRGLQAPIESSAGVSSASSQEGVVR
ncbi:MAG: RNA polymerase sigma factor [Acidobacteriota bacterium]